MKYNEPEKWELLRTYARSVDRMERYLHYLVLRIIRRSMMKSMKKLLVAKDF